MFDGTQGRWRVQERAAAADAGGSARRACTAIHWATSKATVEADSWEGMARQLKAPAAEKDAAELTHKLRVLDRLGEQGWELVGHDKEVQIWTFKRKVQ